MNQCDHLRDWVYRVAEGEATPEQAMSVARHLTDCTACRIVLAREQRLAEMLTEDLEDLPVGEDFVESVMATLPQEPPKPRRRRKRWGLKLACWIALLGLLTVPGFVDPTQVASEGFAFKAAPETQSLDPELTPAGLLGALLVLQQALAYGGSTVAELSFHTPSAGWIAVGLLTLLAIAMSSVAAATSVLVVCAAGGQVLVANRSADRS